MISTQSQYDVIVIGAGQAGLATGYYLQSKGMSFTILDAQARVGDVWRNRWDSLRLFTPARYSSLPGMMFPAQPFALPTKDDVADYLESYAQRFNLPVQLGTRMKSIQRFGDMYMLEADNGMYYARHVVVATGTFQKPKYPAFAGKLAPTVQQMHSSMYRNPSQIHGETVLVVGAGSSGGQIALELASTHQTFLAGRDPGSDPRQILGVDLYWWADKLGLLHLRKDGLLGRWLMQPTTQGDKRVGVPTSAITEAGVTWLPRVVDVKDGQPVFEDGQHLNIDAVIWATGFQPDYTWIQGLDVDATGLPVHHRGVVATEPGLYFMGLVSQHWANSHLIGGVGRNAKYIVDVIAERGVTASHALENHSDSDVSEYRIPALQHSEDHVA